MQPASRQDERLPVKFFMNMKKDTKRSEKEGRPIYKEVPYVKIIVPSDKHSIVTHEVTEEDKRRFRARWEAFERGQNQEAADGMPLKYYPGLTRSQVEELVYFSVFTVEQFADMQSGQVSQLGDDFKKAQRAAKDYLASAKDNAHISVMRAELDRKNNDVEALREQVRELSKLVMTSRSTARQVEEEEAPEPEEASFEPEEEIQNESVEEIQPVKRRPGRPKKAR